MFTGLTFEVNYKLLTGVLPLVLLAKSIETYRLLLADIRNQQYMYINSINNLQSWSTACIYKLVCKTLSLNNSSSLLNSSNLLERYP